MEFNIWKKVCVLKYQNIICEKIIVKARKFIFEISFLNWKFAFIFVINLPEEKCKIVALISIVNCGLMTEGSYGHFLELHHGPIGYK